MYPVFLKLAAAAWSSSAAGRSRRRSSRRCWRTGRGHGRRAGDSAGDRTRRRDASCARVRGGRSRRRLVGGGGGAAEVNRQVLAAAERGGSSSTPWTIRRMRPRISAASSGARRDDGDFDDGRAPALAGLLREALDAWLPGDLDAWMAAADEARREWKRHGVPMERAPADAARDAERLYEDDGNNVPAPTPNCPSRM